MKVALALSVLLLVSGTQAGFFDGLKSTFSSIGSAFTTTFQQVGESAKQVGQGLLDNLKEQGTQLAGQALQSLLLGGMQALQNTGTTTGTKRDVADITKELENLIGNKIEEHKKLLTQTIDALTTVGALIPHDSKLSSVFSTVDNIVHAHNTASNKISEELVEGILAHYASALSKSGNQKRTISGLLSSLGSTVASLFQSTFETSKQMVGCVANNVKMTAASAAETVQPHVTALTSGQDFDLLGHGSAALSGLQSAVHNLLTSTSQQCVLQPVLQHGQQLINNVGTAVTSLLSQNPQPVV